MLPGTRSFALTVAALLAFCGTSVAGTLQMPDWAREAAARPQKTYDSRTNAVALLDEHTVTVTHSGEYIESVRGVVRILRPAGKDEATVAIPIGKGDKLIEAHAWSSSPDGHNYEIRGKDFLQVGIPGSGELYSDVIHYVGDVPGANPGAVVAFQYSYRKRAWGDYTTWHVQLDIPVEEARFILELPAGWNYQSSWMNSAPVAPVATPATPITWLLHDVAPFDNEEKHRLSQSALAIRMQVAFSPADQQSPVFASWSSIGKWNEELVQPRREPTPEITAKVQQLTASTRDFDSIVANLAAFVQQEIRYVAIEIGLGGWQPHAAGDVFQHRYGDCKDKATLLASMLQVKGIRSRNVSIHTDHGVTREDQPGNLFDHEILAIEIPAGSKSDYKSVVNTKAGTQYLIFDPTNQWIPVGDLPEYEQGSFALLAGKDGGELVKLPLFPPEQSRLERAGKFTITPDGAVTGELQVHSSGSHAWRSRRNVSSESELERTKSAENYVTASVHGALLKQAKYDNLDKIGQEFVGHYSFTAPAFLKSSGPLLLFQPCIFGHKEVSIDWKKRKYPIDLESTTQEMDIYEVTLPAELEVDDLPDPIQVDVGFASYKSKVSNANGVIVYQREYVVRDPLVPLEKLNQLKRLEDAITRDESSSVVLKKKN